MPRERGLQLEVADGIREGRLAAHGGYHLAQINAVNAKDFSSEAKTWEAMKSQLDGIAGTLTGGIVKQFPQKFDEPTV
jgi:hypothetical protein